MRYIRLIRAKHWIKNLLVFMPMACAGLLADPQALKQAFAAFAAFSTAASSIYVFNDLKDVEKDRLHPVKKNRPVASGAVTKRQARAMGVLMATLALAACDTFDDPMPAIAVLAYLVINAAYGMKLKHVPVADVACLTAGFALRLWCGAAATGVEVSGYLYLTVLSAAAWMSMGKRRNELLHTDGETRPVLKEYTAGLLDRARTSCATLMIAFYALWATRPGIGATYGETLLPLSIPIVMLITMRYALDVEKSQDGDPVEVLLGDKFLLAACLAYAALMAAALYL